jgi:hypothetical protein
MAVKDTAELLQELEAARSALSRAEAAVLRKPTESPGMTVRELAERFNVPEAAVVAFAETAGELMGEKAMDPPTARRAALVAAAAQAWENELGPLLTSGQVRDLLGGVSRQRVDELLKSHRLIGLRDSGGRWRFPAFQFLDGRLLEPLISAFWAVTAGAISDWTAASWCVAPDEALQRRTPLDWARGGDDPERLLTVARQDAARLAQ